MRCTCTCIKQKFYGKVLPLVFTFCCIRSSVNAAKHQKDSVETTCHKQNTRFKKSINANKKTKSPYFS